MKQENNLIDIRKSNKKDEIFSNKELNRQKSDFDAKFEIINTSNDFLNPKTKNLKIVLQNLELMKDFEFNIESENNDTPQSKYNFFKNKINKNLKTNKKDLKEINDFNKTVLKNDFWGEPNIPNINGFVNNKPPLHYSHNIKKLINFPIIGFPRHRLPPISSKYNMTKSGLNFRKVKVKNLSRGNFNDDQKKLVINF